MIHRKEKKKFFFIENIIFHLKQTLRKKLMNRLTLFGILPEEISLTVVSFLNWKDVLLSKRICWNWRRFMRHAMNIFIRSFFERDYDTLSISEFYFLKPRIKNVFLQLKRCEYFEYLNVFDTQLLPAQIKLLTTLENLKSIYGIACVIPTGTGKTTLLTYLTASMALKRPGTDYLILSLSQRGSDKIRTHLGIIIHDYLKKGSSSHYSLDLLNGSTIRLVFDLPNFVLPILNMRGSTHFHGVFVDDYMQQDARKLKRLFTSSVLFGIGSTSDPKLLLLSLMTIMKI